MRTGWASSVTLALMAAASRCMGWWVSSTASLTRRRSARTAPWDTSTPCGWKWARAPRFSRLATAKGSGDSVSTRCTSSGDSTSAIERPGTRSRRGPGPYRWRRRCRRRTARRSASSFSASATTGGRRSSMPRPTSGTTTVVMVRVVSSLDARGGRTSTCEESCSRTIVPPAFSPRSSGWDCHGGGGDPSGRALSAHQGSCQNRAHFARHGASPAARGERERPQDPPARH